jgi:hypothetical protein
MFEMQSLYYDSDFIRVIEKRIESTNGKGDVSTK